MRKTIKAAARAVGRFLTTAGIVALSALAVAVILGVATLAVAHILGVSVAVAFFVALAVVLAVGSALLA